MTADRILIYGVTGSGKTTLARAIAERTGLPWTEADQLTWEPNWTAVDQAEQRRRFAEICLQDKWILDTAYGAWVDLPLARAQLIVGLDYPRWRSLSRLLKRTAARAVDKREICNGNTESWRGAFAKDSIVLWHFRTFARKRKRMRAWAADPAAPTTVLLTSPKQTEAWLRTLETSQRPS